MRGSTPRDIVVFALGLLLVPPAVLLLVEWLAALVGERVWRVVHVLFVAGLAALIAAPGGEAGRRQHRRVAGRRGRPRWARPRPSSTSASSAVRSFLTILMPAPLVFAALFLFHSPVEQARLRATSADREVGARRRPRSRSSFIVFDELSTASLLDASEEINAERFPNFAALADDATFYREATTVHAFTEHAVPAILTGSSRAGRASDLRRPSGRTSSPCSATATGCAFASRSRTCAPLRLCRPTLLTSSRTRIDSLVSDSSIVYLHVILPRALRRGLPPVDQTWQDFRGLAVGPADGGGSGSGRLSRSARRCAGSSRSFARSALGRSPSCTFSSRMFPGSRLPLRESLPRRHAVARSRASPTASGTDDAVPDHAVPNARYLLQLGFTDHALGLVLDRLRKTGRLRPARSSSSWPTTASASSRAGRGGTRPT